MMVVPYKVEDEVAGGPEAFLWAITYLIDQVLSAPATRTGVQYIERCKWDHLQVMEQERWDW